MRKLTCGVAAAITLILGDALPALADGAGDRRGHQGSGRHHFQSHQPFRHHQHFGYHHPFRPHHFGHHYLGHHHFQHHHPFAPLVWPYWYGLTYQSSPVIVERQIYVQPETVTPTYQQPAQHYWYYCASARAYYPYVQQCPGGWIPVTPSAPSPTH